jgi:hypothetical protein
VIYYAPREVGLTRGDVEITGAGYARQPFGEQVVFGPALEDWGTITGVFVTDGETPVKTRFVESIDARLGTRITLEPTLSV